MSSASGSGGASSASSARMSGLSFDDSRTIVPLAELLQTQTEVLRDIAHKHEEAIASMQGIRDAIARMDHRQIEADISRKPIPQVSGTSASAWRPLYKSAMENTILPSVERWKTSLDTLLIFIALFSAIVTSFYIQTSGSLSPDSAFQTNQLLANLTEVMVILVRGQNAAPLNLPAQPSFEPEASALRLNLYWSISLVLSISIASLAVAGRGYLAMLVESRHKRPHKKLTDIYDRWLHAERRLGPIIDALSQLLIIAVILFLVGIVDNLMSTWLTSSPRSPLVLGAVISSTALVALAGLSIIAMFIHGCFYPSTSPFQSSASRFFAVSAAWISRRTLNAISYVSNTIIGLFSQSQPADLETVGLRLAVPERKGNAGAGKLVLRDCEVFHAVITTTQDDDAVDLSAAALFRIIRKHCLLLPPDLQQASFHPRTTQTISSGSALTRILNRRRLPLPGTSLHNAMAVRSFPSAIIETLSFLLSPESSLRSNMTAATVIVQLRTSYPGSTFCIDPESTTALIQALIDAATRYSAQSRLPARRQLLWESPFTHAIAALLFAHAHHGTVPRNMEEAVVDAGPLIILLHCSILPGHGIKQVRRIVLTYTIDLIAARLNDLSHPDVSGNQRWDTACRRMITPAAGEFLQRHLSWSCPLMISSALVSETFDKNSGVTGTLLRWAVGAMGMDFVCAVVNGMASHFAAFAEKEAMEQLTLDDPPHATDILRYLGQFERPGDSLLFQEKSRSLVVGLAQIVMHLGRANQASSHVHPTWHEDKKAFVHCNLFCYYSTSILDLLERIKIYDPHTHTYDAHPVCTDEDRPTWLELCHTLRQGTVHSIHIQLSHRASGAQYTDAEHRQAVKTRLWHAFRPFFNMRHESL